MKIWKAEAIFSNHQVIKQRSFYFQFYNLPYCLKVVPYTKYDISNISDFTFDCEKAIVYIPDIQRKNILLKILQKTASISKIDDKICQINLKQGGGDENENEI